MSNTNYLFLTSYIRAREVNLLDKKRLEQMAEAADFDEAAKVLMDCGYPDLTGASDAQLEEAFQTRRAEFLQEMERFCPEKQLVQAFRLKYDYHNAKVLIKAEGADVDGGQLLSGCGRVSPQVLADAYYEDDWRMVPSPLAAAIRQAKSTLARTANPQNADFILDRDYYGELLSVTETLSTDFYTKYVRLAIDVANLRSAVRCVRGRMDESVLRAALIDGGNVSAERIGRHVYGDGVVSVFRDRALTPCAELGQQAIEGQVALAAFERACDNVLTGFLTGAKQVSFGPEVAVAYLAGLEGEIVAARMILLGKRGGLTPETLRERLREAYV